MNTYKLNFHPSEKELFSFLPALKKEFEETGRGMFCNWDIIIKQHYNDRVFTFIVDKEPVGFLTWSRDEKVVSLDIIWISPKFRGLGFGVLFQKLIDKEFTKRGDVALLVKCATINGYKLAMKSNFSPFSSTDNISNYNKIDITYPTYIKILKNTDFDICDKTDCYIKIYEDLKKQIICHIIPLNYDFESNPTYFRINGEWIAEIYYEGKLLVSKKLKYLLMDLNTKLFSWRVACFDHKINLPNKLINK